MPPEDNAVNTEVVQQDTTVTDSAPVENKDPEVAEDIMEATLDELDPSAEDTEDEVAEKPTEVEETQETQPQGEEKPLAPKSENRFQKLANENREMREQLDRLKLQESQLATEQELLNEINPETGDYYTPQEVERIAFQQSRQAQAQTVAQQRYNLEVQQNQQTIATEAERALTDFPIFDSQSKEYNPELAAQADQLLAQSLIFDQQGQLVGSNLSPYQLYKSIADATKANAPIYQAQAQKATEKMLANADVPGSASKATKTKVDPDLEAFDEEAASW